MEVIQKLKIDLLNPGVKPVVSVMQADQNSRSLKIALFANGVEWLIPDGASFSVAYEKPDGTKGLYDSLPDGSSASFANGNVLSIRLAPQMLTVPGDVASSVVISSSDQKISTFPVVVNVIENPSVGVTESEDYYWLSTLEAIGNMDNLKTKDKSSLVSAINEIFSMGGGSDSSQNVNPVEKTDDMTQPVGVDENGRLYTAPGGPDYTLPVGGDELGGVKNGGNVVINEDGTMTAPGSVQPDWNQNDPAQPDYVKNRTHWEENTGATIEWDGNTEEKDTFSISAGYAYYKMSELTPTIEELMGGKVSWILDGTQNEHILDDSSLLSGEGCHVCGNAAIIVTQTPCSFSGMTFEAPSTGVYMCMFSEGMTDYMITYGSTTVHQLDEKFIPDTIARVADIPDAIPMPPTASAGQFIVVTSVDENGKVTAVKAIENPVTDEHINALIDAKLAEIEVLPNAEEVAF